MNFQTKIEKGLCVDNRKLKFWFEVVAIESFGIAWLIRGISMPNKKEIDEYKSHKMS